MSALGIAIGVAAIVAVLGLSASSSAGLLAEIERLGTNLLTVTNGQSLTGKTAELPDAAPAMIARIGPVTQVARHRLGHQRQRLPQPAHPGHRHQRPQRRGRQPRTAARRRHQRRPGQLPQRRHRHEPVGVLGAAAAQRLGIDRVYPRRADLVDNQWFYVAGILKPAALAPEIDTSVLVGFPAAETYLGFDGHPTKIYVRAQTDQVNAVDRVLAAPPTPRTRARSTSASHRPRWSPRPTPRAPSTACSSVSVRSPCSSARSEWPTSWSSPCSNAASEIGLRRALGATKGHIRTQFLSEAILLALLGGAVGVALGVARDRRVRATPKTGPIVIPTVAWAGGLVAALVIGAIAGLLPALRAARMSPTEALWAI